MNDIEHNYTLPYYAVIFSSVRTQDDDSYEEMAGKMVELARTQEGFLGIESARDDIGITVSYWRSLEAIQLWKKHTEHKIAQQFGRKKWYAYYRVRIAKVEREYAFKKS